MAFQGGSEGVEPGPPVGRRAHALELVLAGSDDRAVRRRWSLLEEAGVPSAARHTGATHRPHVTVAGGPRPSEQVLARAAGLLGPLLPQDLPVSGLGVLGRPARAVLVELVAPSLDVRTAREEVVALWAGADDRPWLPHLTLAPRLAPDAVASALAALGEESRETDGRRRVVALRWWDPDRGEVTLLAGDGIEEGPAPG